MSAARYVEWLINTRDGGHWHEVVRREKGNVHLIGGSSSLREAIGIAQTDRIRVLHDPEAIEFRPLEYRIQK